MSHDAEYVNSVLLDRLQNITKYPPQEAERIANSAADLILYLAEQLSIYEQRFNTATSEIRKLAKSNNDLVRFVTLYGETMNSYNEIREAWLKEVQALSCMNDGTVPADIVEKLINE